MMKRIYIYQQPEWPRLHWRDEELAGRLAEIRHRQGRLIGRMESIGFRLQQEAMLDTLTADVVKSSEIEGEFLDAGQVRSSVARQLGLDIGGLRPPDRSVDGIVELMLNATQSYAHPLTDERLFGWHAALFPTGWSGSSRITVGSYRTEGMQVVSGAMGRERVHYEAPPADQVEAEMRGFLDWFNAPGDTDAVFVAALAHLWFVVIHPFDDGNGRIARAITDMALARSEGIPQRFYSMSSQIRLERNSYYDVLENAGKGTTDVTEWMDWFVNCLGRAVENAEVALEATLHKARFWDRIAGVPINERQGKILNLLMGDFRGKLTTSKWAKIGKCSPATAFRDITELVDRGILARSPEGGRSTSYHLVND